ncbi:MAG: LPS export ABC transporter periplasmic protein LptC [Pseudomonadota bacterium]
MAALSSLSGGSDTEPTPERPANKLDRLLRQSQRLSPRAVQRHSRNVRHLRLAVPAIAGALVMVYAVNASPPRIDPEFVREFQQIQAEGRAMRLDRPRYAGEDERGLPFEIAARAAEQDPLAPDLVALENPEALRNVKSEEGVKPVKVRAATGMLNTESNQMALTSDVELEHDIGGGAFVLKTDAADVDLENSTVSSTVGVTGEGERGTVAADTLKAYQDEGRLVLEGNVRLRLNPAPSAKEKTSPLR